MKYAFITAALAAASLATTVNIDVEGAELSTENNRHHVGRHHRDHNRGRHWWTDIFGRGGNDRNDRNGRRGRNDGRDRRPGLDELLQDLFEVNYECSTEAVEGSKDEWLQCYRRRAEDINDDLLRRDDEIFHGDDNMDEESGRRNRGHGRGRGRGRNHRNHRGGRRNHRYVDEDQMAMEVGRNEEYQCSVDIPDPLRKHQIAVMCCEQLNLGHFNPEDQTCDIEGRDDKNEFQACAIDQGALDANCRRERGN